MPQKRVFTPVYQTTYLPLSEANILYVHLMAINNIKELAAARAKVAALEQSIAKELQQKLAKLPSEYGFDNVSDFIAALKEATGGRGAKGSKGGRGGKRAKRAKITPELKEKVKEAVKAGKTGAAIASEFGISLPSVQNIKKEFGLVKKRA